MLLTVTLIGGGLWVISDRAATERAGGEDLRDMVQWLNKSSWPEASAALERGKARLGNRGSAGLRRLLEQGAHELELAARLDAICLNGSYSGGEVLDLARSDEEYEAAFRGAGLGQVHDDPKMVAERVAASNICNALVAALDDWATSHAEPASPELAAAGGARR